METFPLNDPNAQFTCEPSGLGDGLSCNVSCNDGYLYRDSTTSQIVSCNRVGMTQEFAWDNSEPMVCLRKCCMLLE